MSKHNIGERIAEFAGNCMKLARSLKSEEDANDIRRQLIRSSSSVSLNYEESRAAESTKDFVHKLLISLKELRESNRNLDLLVRSEFCDKKDIEPLSKEGDELAAILFTSIRTSKKNNDDLDWRTKKSNS